MARDAYTGPPFVLHRQYAERFADAWVILSAKYGFLAPEDLLSGPYEVTFKKAFTGSIALARLQEEVRKLELDQAEHMVGHSVWTTAAPLEVPTMADYPSKLLT